MNAVPIVLAASMLQIVAEVVLVVAILVLVPLGLTLFFVGGYYVLRNVLAYRQGRSYEAARTREVSRSQASGMGWLALKVGPIFGLSYGLLLCIGLATFGALSPWSALWLCIIIIGLSTFSGAIAAGAFWTSAAFLRQARKQIKRFRGAGVWDRELDGAP